MSPLVASTLIATVAAIGLWDELSPTGQAALIIALGFGVLAAVLGDFEEHSRDVAVRQADAACAAATERR